jgi:DNA replication protein DnaC
MMYHPTLDKLKQLKLMGMLRALQEQESIPDIRTMPFEERFGLIVDRELTEKDNRRMQTRLRMAKLKQNSALEDIDFKTPRELDRSLIMKLSDYGRDGFRQNISGLRTGAQSLPRRIQFAIR